MKIIKRSIFVLALYIPLSFCTQTPISESMDNNALQVLCAMKSNSPIAVCRLTNYRIDSIAKTNLTPVIYDTFYSYSFKIRNYLVGNSSDSAVILRSSNSTILNKMNKDMFIILNKNQNEYYDNYQELRIGKFEYDIREIIDILSISKSYSKSKHNTKCLQLLEIYDQLNCQ